MFLLSFQCFLLSAARYNRMKGSEHDDTRKYSEAEINRNSHVIDLLRDIIAKKFPCDIG